MNKRDKNWKETNQSKRKTNKRRTRIRKRSAKKQCICLHVVRCWCCSICALAYPKSKIQILTSCVHRRQLQTSEIPFCFSAWNILWTCPEIERSHCIYQIQILQYCLKMRSQTNVNILHIFYVYEKLMEVIT